MVKRFAEYNNFSINEGLISLTLKEREQVEIIIDRIEREILKDPNSDTVKYLGKIDYIFSDGYEGTVHVSFGEVDDENLAHYSSNLEFIGDTHLPYEIVDGDIVINKDAIRKLLNNQKSFPKEDRQFIRVIIKHELIHAKDPSLNHHYREYTNKTIEDYYSQFAELKAFTGEFVDNLDTLVDNFVASKQKNPIQLNILQEVMKNILNVFSGKEQIFSDETINFFSTGILQRVSKNPNRIIPNKFKFKIPIMNSWRHFQKIKKYNHIGYKKFLGQLYVHFTKFQEKINNSIKGDNSLRPIKIVN